MRDSVRIGLHQLFQVEFLGIKDFVNCLGDPNFWRDSECVPLGRRVRIRWREFERCKI